jgi:hypothetical protein
MISSRVRRRPKVRKPKLTVPGELTEQFLELKRLRRQVGELEAAGSEQPHQQGATPTRGLGAADDNEGP